MCRTDSEEEVIAKASPLFFQKTYSEALLFISLLISLCLMMASKLKKKTKKRSSYSKGNAMCVKKCKTRKSRKRTTRRHSSKKVDDGGDLDSQRRSAAGKTVLVV